MLISLLFLVAAFAWLAWGAVSASNAISTADTPTPTLVPGTGAVAGFAWQDLNANGVWEAGEPPLTGMQVTLSQSGPPLLGVMTGPDGAYRFTALTPGLYQVSATAPAGYRLTTPAQQSIFVSAGAVLALDFGAVFVPTLTPTSTPIPMIDIGQATFAYCGGVIQGDTHTGKNNVSQYACRPSWLEDGPELVYRVELGRAQPLTAMFLTTEADLDLFLLPSAYPESCLAGADNTLSYDVQPGVYYLVVDGYQGAAGSFLMRIDCPYGVQATVTPTPTASPTLTPSPTLPPTATPTPSPTSPPKLSYLPVVLVPAPPTPVPLTLILQQDVNGYTGAVDTWISAWPGEDQVPHGSDEILRFRYNRQTTIKTHKVPLIGYDLALVPNGATIVKAELKLYLVDQPAADVRVAVHGMLRSWDAATATWQQAAAGVSWYEWGAQGSGSDHMAAVTDVQQILQAGTWYTLDVTSLVRLWLQDPLQNFGMILLAQGGDSDSNVEAGFTSSEYTEHALRPQLVVTYWVQ